MPPYISWPAGFRISPAKITRFLLNPVGQKPARARDFLGMGFDPAVPWVLADALFQHTTTLNYGGIIIAPYGFKMIFEGPIQAPDGTTPRVRSVWQMRNGHPAAAAGFVLLVTAYRI